MEFSLTQKGNRVLLYGGYEYTMYRENENEEITWRCRVYFSTKCRAFLKTCGDNIIGIVPQHCHDSNPQKAQASILKIKMKQDMKAVGASARNILGNNLLNVNMDVLQHLPKQSSLTRNLFRSLKATLVSPCTQKHVDKYRQHNSYMILETPQIYREITLPHLKTDQFNLQWLYNIFSGEKEADRILHRDKDDDERGIVVLPDLHWDGLDHNNFHLLTIPLKHGILSIRDLTNKDLPLLYHIRDKSIEVVKQKFGFKREHLRMYFHYQPSFYHLHVHVTYLHHEAPGIFAEKAHLLDTVIDNIELISDYYQRASLPFTVRETDSLFTVYKDAGIIADHILVKE